jgi:hypothetical protein
MTSEYEEGIVDEIQKLSDKASSDNPDVAMVLKALAMVYTKGPETLHDLAESCRLFAGIQREVKIPKQRYCGDLPKKGITTNRIIKYMTK